MRTLHLTGLALAIATGFALPLAGRPKPRWAGPFLRLRSSRSNRRSSSSLATISAGTTTAGRARAGTGATTRGVPATAGAAATVGMAGAAVSGTAIAARMSWRRARASSIRRMVDGGPIRPSTTRPSTMSFVRRNSMRPRTLSSVRRNFTAPPHLMSVAMARGRVIATAALSSRRTSDLALRVSPTRPPPGFSFCRCGPQSTRRSAGRWLGDATNGRSGMWERRLTPASTPAFTTGRVPPRGRQALLASMGSRLHLPRLRQPWRPEFTSMNISIAHLQPIVSLIAGVLILMMPRSLN